MNKGTTDKMKDNKQNFVKNGYDFIYINDNNEMESEEKATKIAVCGNYDGSLIHLAYFATDKQNNAENLAVLLNDLNEPMHTAFHNKTKQ